MEVDEGMGELRKPWGGPCRWFCIFFLIKVKKSLVRSKKLKVIHSKLENMKQILFKKKYNRILVIKK